ncbi:Gluconate transport-inducing protein [Scheffersomyces spartinae]|uniref:peptidyl-tRNA hydrolase n=1 Tax=Scheffersomyces spartinae TaxID=45513 RepID=A0A9P8AIM4_9ASCO|nr:Gluconate transport-inducing protein [Scheffersomyces spartinae]KAG7194533.1 Gluconate transport-inducing protein [Scheffersomyces spartinae]
MSPRFGLWELLGVGIASFMAGYGVHLIVDQGNVVATKHEQVEDDDGHDESQYDESDSDVEIDSKALNSIPGEVRMTLIVRQDLKMTKGKAAAQCSHATLALYRKMTDPSSNAYNPEMIKRWEYGNGQAKITLQVPNQEEMDTLFAQAMSLGINAYIVHDAGRTQIAAGSATVLGIGPAPKVVIDEITHSLKLY